MRFTDFEGYAVRAIYTVGQICNETGYPYDFLKIFIPWPLKPKGWDEMNLSEQETRKASGNLLFEQEDFQRFQKMIYQEVFKNWEIIQAMKSMSNTLESVQRVLLKIDNYLFNFSEMMTLKEVARELKYKNPGSLRNRMRTIQEGGEKIGLLELPGFALRLYKIKGQWMISRFDFLKQTQQLGINKRLQYFRRQK